MARQANGTAIRALREAEGMSQTDLARRVGITASQLSKVERGANGMSPPVLRRVATVLGCDPAAIETEPVAS